MTSQSHVARLLGLKRAFRLPLFFSHVPFLSLILRLDMRLYLDYPFPRHFLFRLVRQRMYHFALCLLFELFWLAYAYNLSPSVGHNHFTGKTFLHWVYVCPFSLHTLHTISPYSLHPGDPVRHICASQPSEAPYLY